MVAESLIFFASARPFSWDSLIWKDLRQVSKDSFQKRGVCRYTVRYWIGIVVARSKEPLLLGTLCIESWELFVLGRLTAG